MGKFIDLTGKEFGRLKVLKRVENDKKNNSRFLCECKCGNKTIVNSHSLNSGHTKSCNCLQVDAVKKHGKSNTRLYCIYVGIKERCLKEKNINYKDYGGRGITICDEWLNKENGFTNFYEWAINNGYKKELTIDRIDVNGNYNPSNCRWASYEDQNNNKRKSIKIIFKGNEMTAKQIGKIVGFSHEHIRRLYKKGINLDIKFNNIDLGGLNET